MCAAAILLDPSAAAWTRLGGHLLQLARLLVLLLAGLQEPSLLFPVASHKDQFVSITYAFFSV